MKASFDIDDEIMKEFNHYVPWGMKSEILRALMKVLLSQIKEDGGDILGTIVAGTFRIEKVT